MNSQVDQDRIRDVTRGFVEKEISFELSREIDQQDIYPEELLRKFSRTGLWGINIAEKYGGMGGRSVDAMPVYEELSRRLPVLAWVIGNIMLYGNDIIGINGSDAQKEKFLPALSQGKLRFSFALTEPDAGSDAANISTKAVFQDGAYWITGNKMFITGAGVSDYVVTLTRTAPSRYRGITAFVVDTSISGYSASPLKKLGYHGSNTCSVHYENVRIAPEDILGGEACLNQGWQHMTSLLNSERLALSACALGIGQAALDETIAYCKEHYRFTNPNGRFQAIQHAIAEMATELEAARRLAYHAASLVRQEKDCLKETSMSKYFTTETAKKIALRGIDLLGNEGGTLAFNLQRYLRDVLVLTIGGGTSQIQKNIIAKQLGLAVA
ncbi:MAG TPA: acyl-CoA dehydrogenase family protein [Anaerolineales bacterium]